MSITQQISISILRSSILKLNQSNSWIANLRNQFIEEIASEIGYYKKYSIFITM
ncbi:unnamed protein product [Paramecium pentaurelia]|uniref:Uncharacterized protein n=1 Tax=Paramecium pentaurelia TaxID=43138 RepID=A0A8S1UVC0_9CILI|nr:unnamed protein product [Paramecium pentaurelia]